MAPSAAQSRLTFSTALRVRALRRGHDEPAVDEQARKAGIGTRLLGAGDRMARHEMGVSRQARRQRRDHGAFYGADIRDDRAFPQGRRNELRQICVGADRHAEDHEIGALHCLARIRRVGIAEFQSFRARQNLGRIVGNRDRAGRRWLSQSARDRRADQADAENRDALEQRRFKRGAEATRRHDDA